MAMATSHVEDISNKEALNFPEKDHLDSSAIKSNVIRDAKKASDSEHKMTLLQGIKLYPKAVAWSLLISTCIAMEGYDVCLLSNFYRYDQRAETTWRLIQTYSKRRPASRPFENDMANNSQMDSGRFQHDGNPV